MENAVLVFAGDSASLSAANENGFVSWGLSWHTTNYGTWLHGSLARWLIALAYDAICCRGTERFGNDGNESFCTRRISGNGRRVVVGFFVGIFFRFPGFACRAFVPGCLLRREFAFRKRRRLENGSLCVGVHIVSFPLYDRLHGSLQRNRKYWKNRCSHGAADCAGNWMLHFAGKNCLLYNLIKSGYIENSGKNENRCCSVGLHRLPAHREAALLAVRFMCGETETIMSNQNNTNQNNTNQNNQNRNQQQAQQKQNRSNAQNCTNNHNGDRDDCGCGK